MCPGGILIDLYSTDVEPQSHPLFPTGKLKLKPINRAEVTCRSDPGPDEMSSRELPSRTGRQGSGRACDACHVRRTKCSGGLPCIKCSKSCLRCTYARPIRKKGPKGKTIDMLQAILGAASESSDEATSVATTSAVTLTPAPITDGLPPSDDVFIPWTPCTTSRETLFDPAPAQSQDAANFGEDFDFGLTNTINYPVFPLLSSASISLQSCSRPPLVPSTEPSPERHSGAAQLVLLEGFLAKCLQKYIRHILRLGAIVDPEQLQQRFRDRVHLHDKQFAAFLVAASALSLFITPSSTVSTETQEKANAMVDFAISLHNTADLGARPSLYCIATSMTLSAVVLVLKGPVASFIRHREAIALAEILNLADPRAYDAFDPVEREGFLRILWMLAIAERSNSLLMVRPTIIKSPLSSLPVAFRLESGLSFGLVPTAKLYETITPALIDCINGQCTPPTCAFSSRSVLAAHEGLEGIGTEGCLSAVQSTDALLTAQWLHIKLWHGCVMHSILSAAPDCPELSIEYPLKVLAKVAALVQTLPRWSVLCNGHAMGKKLGIIADVCRAALLLLEPLNIPTPFSSKAQAADALSELQTLASEATRQKWFRWQGIQCDCCDNGEAL